MKSIKLPFWCDLYHKCLIAQDGQEPCVDELLGVASICGGDFWGDSHLSFSQQNFINWSPNNQINIINQKNTMGYKQLPTISPKDKQLDIHDVREALVLCGKPARPVSSICICVFVFVYLYLCLCICLSVFVSLYLFICICAGNQPARPIQNTKLSFHFL